MSHESKLDLLRKADRAEYKTYLYFVSTEDPFVNLGRVKERAKKGGHDVPSEKVFKRYKRSFSLLREAVQLTYRSFIFDNSGKKPELILEVEGGKKITYKTKKVPVWVRKHLLEKDA